MDLCFDLINNKDKLPAKYRFKLMGVCDKYNSNWKESDEWNNNNNVTKSKSKTKSGPGSCILWNNNDNITKSESKTKTGSGHY